MAAVTYEIEVSPDDLNVRGNAIASGDDTFDRQVEDEIIGRLDNGDVWTWCSVHVVARLGNFEGDAWLGACSYKDEEDFKQGGYYIDMKRDALEDLQAVVRQAQADLTDADENLAVERRRLDEQAQWEYEQQRKEWA